MIHEWWGLNEDTTILADVFRGKVAREAAEAFRGKVAREAAEARKQTTEIPATQITSDLDAAFRFLTTLPKVRRDKIASLGFCFGGTQSMRMVARNPGLASVVIFYGGCPFQTASKLGNIDKAGPVLGIYGEKDQGFPVEQVRNFEAAFWERGIPHTITIYPNVGHAFVKSTTYNKGGAPEQAFIQAVSFLKQNLR